MHTDRHQPFDRPLSERRTDDTNDPGDRSTALYTHTQTYTHTKRDASVETDNQVKSGGYARTIQRTHTGALDWRDPAAAHRKSVPICPPSTRNNTHKTRKIAHDCGTAGLSTNEHNERHADLTSPHQVSPLANTTIEPASNVKRGGASPADA